MGGAPPPPMPPVPQDSDSQAVNSPSFFAPILTFAYDEGRAPATISSELRSRNIYRLSVRHLRQERRLIPPSVDGKLAAESAADVILLNVDVGGRYLDHACQLICDARNVLRGNMHQQALVISPLRSCSV